MNGPAIFRFHGLDAFEFSVDEFAAAMMAIKNPNSFVPFFRLEPAQRNIFDGLIDLDLMDADRTGTVFA